MSLASRYRIICSTSGGKDSTACYVILSKLFGSAKFEAVFSDTGQEHPVTLNYLRNLHAFANGPRVHFVKSDFSSALIKRGVQPTGNPFIDLTLFKSGLPSPLARFCTSLLKMDPILTWARETITEKPILFVTGVRWEESAKRAKLAKFSSDTYISRSVSMTYDRWNPIIQWKEKDVFSFLMANNVKPNPLYNLGFKRIGCFPCIFTGKKQLALLPDWVWNKLESWEQLIGKGWFQWLKGSGTGLTHARDVKQWCKTKHGGGEIDTNTMNQIDAPSCMSEWGFCE